MNAFELFGHWPVRPGAAGVLVRATSEQVRPAPQSGPPSSSGPRARIDLTETFGDLDEVSDWASVTKLVVSLAVLAESEQGRLDLDDPCGPPGSTVRHLLSHASGLGPDRREPLTSPGRSRIYSNAGFEVLAEYLSERCARSWIDVVADDVTGPLGMDATIVAEGGSPASGVRGSVADLLALGRELLSPTIVSPSVLNEATQVAFPGLAGVVPGIGRFERCDWGLGFEIKGTKRPHWTATASSPRTFGHFGRSGAFVWVDPDAGISCATAGGAPFGPWALERWPELSDAVLSEWSAQAVRPGIAERAP